MSGSNSTVFSISLHLQFSPLHSNGLSQHLGMHSQSQGIYFLTSFSIGFLSSDASNLSKSWDGSATDFYAVNADGSQGSSLRDADGQVQKVMYPMSVTVP